MSPASPPSVSVVVPVLNGAASIDECVRSLLELSYPPERLDLRIVDNGSTDGTIEALRAYGSRITLLQESQRGAAAARNAGVAGSAAEVIAFTDADCIVDPGWLRALVPALGDESVGIAGGAILAARPANDVARFGEVVHDHRQAIKATNPPYAITMNWASRRRVLDELGGFDVRFLRCQDVDLSYRALQAGYRLAYVAEAVVHHRNERTLPGLFREGFVHGFHGVHARKHHADFLRSHGHGRGGPPRLKQIGAGLRAWVQRRDPSRARCESAFNSGKKAGRLLGSARFGRLDV